MHGSLNGTRAMAAKVASHPWSKMLRQLSEIDRETLKKFGDHGPEGDYNISSLNRLFTLDLIEIDDDRRVVLTKAGRATYSKLMGK